MALCSAYLDASGKSRGYPAMTVAGYAAPVAKWSRFEKQWRAALDAEGIKIFHATDFAASKGEFKEWKGDRPRRSRFLSSLIGIIKKSTNKMISIGVEIDAWDNVNQKYQLEETFYSPYALAGYVAVITSSGWAYRKGHILVILGLLVHRKINKLRCGIAGSGFESRPAHQVVQ
jgi:hypothetical protein